MKQTPNYRRPLNTEQLNILKILYIFRFSTAELLARYLQKQSKKNIQKQLKILEEQAYIAKRYDGSYKLRGRPAAYYITPKGVRRFAESQEDQFQLPKHILPAVYKNATTSEHFIEHCYQSFEVFLWFKEAYGARKQYHVLFELDKEITEDCPQPLPSAYITLTIGDKPKAFLLDVCDTTTPFFVYIRRIKKYLEYADSGDWQGVFDGDEFPIILMISDTAGLQKRLHKRIRSELRRTEVYEEVEFVTTSLEALRSAATDSAEIWQSSELADELFTLEQL